MAGKPLEHYLALTYPVELQPDPEQGGYFARHPDLPGCTAEGETADEAVENLNESRELWLEARLESGYPVPEPPSAEFGGRISLRVSPSLHASLFRSATRRGMSLNQLLTNILSEWAGGMGAAERVAEEVVARLRGVLPPARAGVEVLTVKTETKTETKETTETRTRPVLVHGAATAIAEASHG